MFLSRIYQYDDKGDGFDGTRGRFVDILDLKEYVIYGYTRLGQD